MMLLSIRETTTTLALNFRSIMAGMKAITTPVRMATTKRMGSITMAGRPFPSLRATQVTVQADSMKMPSGTRLKRLTAYMKHIAKPQRVKGMARLMILPIRRGEDRGPRMNCWTIYTGSSLMAKRITRATA